MPRYELSPGTDDMNPGDEAPPGSPGNGEAVGPDCAGSGRQEGEPCRTCNGTDKVSKGIGGA